MLTHFPASPTVLELMKQKGADAPELFLFRNTRANELFSNGKIIWLLGILL
jgi:hypothetical protein